MLGDTMQTLWNSMGYKTTDKGIEEHGQSCYLRVYPKGPETLELLKDIDADLKTIHVDGDVPRGPIHQVAAMVLDNLVKAKQIPAPEVFEYDGLRAGAGWIYSALLIAIDHGATQAKLAIHSNDGNLFMECWNRGQGVYVTAVHYTYYGS
jgi:hypothetical protein